MILIWQSLTILVEAMKYDGTLKQVFSVEIWGYVLPATWQTIYMIVINYCITHNMLWFIVWNFALCYG
ncbi:MAG: hypothetical protein LBR59_01960 [Endomicrobium sp.]|jgi:hypothetical protein|nr:hypothetical protein [Endomicrobium sp.]